jgi:hypothetical protein
VHAFGACINERFGTKQKPRKPHIDQLPLRLHASRGMKEGKNVM